jgi:hypothetical protein
VEKGPSKTAARSALHEAITDRQHGGPSRAGVSVDLRRRGGDPPRKDRAQEREDSTRALYVFHLEGAILSGLGPL